MIKVKIKNGMSEEKLISIFKRKVKDSKIIYDMQQRQFHEKKGDKKRRKKKFSEHRSKKDNINPKPKRKKGQI